MRQALRDHAARIAEDPLTNSVWALARELFMKLERGEIAIGDLSTTVREIHASILRQRADVFRGQHALLAADDPWGETRLALQRMAAKGWRSFSERMSQGFGGVVLTAHPTFALSPQIREAVATLSLSPAEVSDDELKAILESSAQQRRIGLADEHGEALATLSRARSVIREFASLIFEVARAAFPCEWRTLAPRLPTLATWVGYDIDGRTDISWRQSLALRLMEKANQVEYYKNRLDALGRALGTSAELERLIERVERAARSSQEEAAACAGDLEDPKVLIAAIERLTCVDADRIVDAEEISRPLRALSNSVDDAFAHDALVLKAEVDACLLGVARIHLRVNAAQVQSAIRHDLGLETEDNSLGRLAMAKLAKMGATTPEASTEFLDLHREQSTARRQFVLAALILRHVDTRSPIRFLIAEAENPATVMGALYLAQRCRIDQALDISPLFETPDAMDRGGRFMERLLDEPAYLDYVRARGRLCVQFGFSDSGRFIGQIAASMAIERLQSLICRAMSKRQLRVPVVMFDTHGESMGRGAVPGDFDQRLRHLLSPWTRKLYAGEGIHLLHETSFQGGDGFLHFASEELSRATIAAHISHEMSAGGEPPDALGDPYYEETDLVWDFYRAMRAWHEAMCADADYALLLSSFSPSFLLPSGSRPSRRPDASTGVRGLRAIPHNGALQQVAALINVACGVGASAALETDRLVALANHSSRFRALLNLGVQARKLTSVPVLRAYGFVYAPDVWIALSRGAPQMRDRYERIAIQLKDYAVFLAIQRLANRVSLDLAAFDRVMAVVAGAPATESRHEQRLDIHVLHAIRQALMMAALAAVARTPRFSDRHDMSYDKVFDLVAQMRLGEAAALLAEIFPTAAETNDPLDRGLSQASAEQARLRQAHTYDDVRHDIIERVEAVAKVIGEISATLCSPYGACG